MATPPCNKSNLVSIEITSGGKPVKQDVIHSIKIGKQVNRISYCEITLLDGQVAKQDFPLSESGNFLPGEAVEVKAGYNSKTESVFKGIITEMGLSVDREMGPSLQIKCKDKAVKMTVGRKNAYFYDKTDKDIMSAIIGQHSGLSAEVGATTGKLPEVVQYYTSDWDFLLSRADHNGMIVTTENGSLSVISTDKVKEEVLEVSYGKDIISFQAHMNALNQYKKVKASAWNIKDQKLITGEAAQTSNNHGNVKGSALAAVSGLKEYELQTTAPLLKSDLNGWAKAQSAKSAFSKIRGTVSFQGTEAVLPAKLLTLKGMGDRFNGKAMVSGVEHEISEGNWITTAELGLDPDWFAQKVTMQAPLASGLLPGIQGLQNGKIKKIDEDPDGELRVQVDLPIANPAAKGIWARYASFYASNGFGAFFYPQVGDEVVLGFFNDDPRFPVVLGSLYSSSRKAAYKPDKDNSKQGIVTKNKLKLEFDDKDKILTLTTPDEHTLVLNDKDKLVTLITKNKNKLVLDDDGKKVTLEDQNKNSIEMSSSGIVIQSYKKLTLKAKQAIELDAGTALNAKAKQAIAVDAGTALNLKAKQAGNLEALSVGIKAKAKAEIKGGASMDLNGGANMKMKAAMIMIN